MSLNIILSPRVLSLTRQFSIFTFVGAFGTAAHYVVLLTLAELFAVNAVIASALGALCGAFVNYLLNYRYTFQSNMPHARALPRFFGFAAIGFLLNTLIMYLGVEVYHFHYFLVQLIATGIVLIGNFTANKIWTFAGDIT